MDPRAMYDDRFGSLWQCDPLTLENRCRFASAGSEPGDNEQVRVLLPLQRDASRDRMSKVNELLLELVDTMFGRRSYFLIKNDRDVVRRKWRVK